MFIYFSIIAFTSTTNRHLLTKVEFQKETDKLWKNKVKNDNVDVKFREGNSDEDYVVKEQLSDINSEQSDSEDQVVDEPLRNIISLLGKKDHRWSTQTPARQGRIRRENIVRRSQNSSIS